MEFGDWLSNSCKSLKVLNLEKVNGIDRFYISSSSLKVLNLVNCTRVEDAERKKNDLWFCYKYIIMRNCNYSIRCSSLENLSISNCKFDSLNLDVDTPLKALQISDCEIYGYHAIGISAEQLQTFTWTMKLGFCQASGRKCGIYSENLPSLRDANLGLVPLAANFSLAESMLEDFANNTLAELITAVKYARNLQLNFQIIEALYLRDELPTFLYLEHLEIKFAELNLDDITAIAAFLVKLCSLNTLTLTCDEHATELSESEVVNRLCLEAEKLGIKCGNMKITITCTA